MIQTEFSSSELEAFQRDGYFLVPNLFTSAEISKLLDFAQQDPEFQKSIYGRRDSEGMETKLALWNNAGNDLYSMFSRSTRIIDRMEQILDGEVYHWHTKMMLKEPRVGGAWEWHQDYGYWYHNGCLSPDLASCLISVSEANRSNGCLQVIRGSQHLGRIEHGKSGDQTGADLERVNAALARLEHVYIETNPGDALFFHSNLLHRSDQNHSERPRWSIICCYNAARNDPYIPSKHPAYSRLNKVNENAILDWQIS